MSFSVITVVIIAFATVFPSGYRLNLSNFNQNKASGLASSVIEELRGMRRHQEGTGVTLRTLSGAGQAQAIYAELTQELRNQLAYGAPAAGNPFPTNRPPFWIPTPGGAHSGIQITENTEVISVGSSISNYVISVNVSWYESRKRALVTKTITINGLVTDALKTTYTK